MAGFTTYGADQFQALVVGSNVTAPASKYLALHVGNPGAAGSANEAAYAGYARTAITSGQFAAISNSSNGRTRLNATTLNWPANASGTTQTFTHVTMWDAVSGGNCWYVYDLTANKAVIPASIPTLVTGDLSHNIKVHA